MSKNRSAIRRVTRIATLGCVFAAIAPASAFAADTQAPTAPGDVAAKAASTQVSLTWTASKDNVAVTDYRVWRRLASAATGTGWSQVGTTSATTFTQTGLTNGTGYVYAVRAADAAGNISGSSATVTATPEAPDTQAPAAPTGLVANAASGQVSLTWATGTDNVGVTGYAVWRRLATGTEWSQIASTTTPSHSDTGLTNGTGYAYAVRALDAAGNVSAASSTVTATPVAPTPPPAPAPTPVPAPGPTTSTDTAVPTGASFDGAMESPLTSAFQLVTELGASAPQRISTTIRRGGYAASMTVKPGQKRSELQANAGGATLKVMPGTTAWFADSIYLAPGFPTKPTVSNGYQTLLQWKDAGGTVSSSPPVSLDIENGEYTLYGGWGCPGGQKQYRISLAPATTGAWTDFEFQIRFDTAGKGWVDSYVNGKQVGSRVTPPCGTMYPAPYAKYNMLRVGYYRDPAIKTAGTVIHDEYRMGATRASVSLYR